MPAVVHDRHTSCYVAGAGSEMDERLTLSRCVPFADRRDAHFQFQSCGHAVHGFEPVGLGRLRVLVQVNESGANHKPGGIDFYLAPQCVRGNRDNLLPVNADPAHGIEPRFRVHHPAALEDDVVGLSGKQ